MESYLQTNFGAGEVGDRLNGTMSEVYNAACKKINNMTVSPIGSLRVFNDMTKNTITGLDNVRFFNDTKESYAFLITDSQVGYMDKETRQVYLIDEDMVGIDRTNTFYYNKKQNFVYSNGTTCKVKQVDLTNNTLIDSDFISKIVKPVQERTPLKVSFYRWGIIKEYDFVSNTYKDKKKLYKIASYTDLESCGSNSTFEILITGITIKRCYFIGASLLDETSFTDTEWNNNDSFVNFEQGEPTDLYINGYNPKFTNLVADGSGNMWSKTLDIKDIPLGPATKGVAVKLDDENIRDIVEFQNRTVILTDDFMYFSKKLNYVDFLNGVDSSSAFWIAASPIKNSKPTMRTLRASKGLYINTDLGFQMLGFYNSLSNIDNVIDIVSDIKPTLESTISNDVLYFCDKQGALYASYNVGEQVTNFFTIQVDKFDIDRFIIGLDTLSLDGVEYIVAKDKNVSDKIYFYKMIGERNFSRVSIQVAPTSSKVFKFDYKNDNGFIINNASTETSFYKIIDNYTTTSFITVLPPAFRTKEKGLYQINKIFSIKEVVVKVLNQKNGDTQALKTMKINGMVIDKIANDEYDIYISQDSFQFQNGFDIEIEHNNNNKKFEILGIEIFYA